MCFNVYFWSHLVLQYWLWRLSIFPLLFQNPDSCFRLTLPPFLKLFLILKQLKARFLYRAIILLFFRDSILPVGCSSKVLCSSVCLRIKLVSICWGRHWLNSDFCSHRFWGSIEPSLAWRAHCTRTNAALLSFEHSAIHLSLKIARRFLRSLRLGLHSVVFRDCSLLIWRAVWLQHFHVVPCSLVVFTRRLIVYMFLI